MKKVMCFVMATGLLAVVGCQKSKPEDAAKAFMNQRIAAHQGFDLDTSGLDYKIVEQNEETAKVMVSGDIAVKAELDLVKSDGKWMVAQKGQGEGNPEKSAGNEHPKAE